MAIKKMSDDLELVAACDTLARFASARLDARRTNELRMSLSIWALLVAATYRGFTHLSWLAGLVLILIYGWYVYGAFKRTAADSQLAWHYVREGQKALARCGIESPKDNSNLAASKTNVFTNWAIGPQIYITFSLLAILYLAGTDEITLFHTTLRPLVAEVPRAPEAPPRPIACPATPAHTALPTTTPRGKTP